MRTETLKIYKIGLSLLPFLLIALISIVIVYQSTKDIANQQKALYLQKKLLEVFPFSQAEELKTIWVPITKNSVLLPAKTNPSQSQIWIICQGFNQAGHIIAVTTKQGYSGTITLLVGLDYANKIVGVSVLKHTETPGLGDKIDGQKTAWLKQFVKHSIDSIWQLRKSGQEKSQGFDAITAATITSKAVVNLLQQSLVSNLSLPTNQCLKIPSQ